MSAGCILNLKFSTVDQEKSFSGYINYMDRAEARGDSMDYEGYTDYMGNPEKSHGLFTADKDHLETADIKKLKEIYNIAYDRGSILWQPIISFENEWLVENHIMDAKTKLIDEGKLREATRNSIGLMLEKENLSNAIWSAAIHYNTDNIHIHVGVAELTPSRTENNAKFKLKNINLSKSRFVNTIISQQKENDIINNIMRKEIIDDKVKKLMHEDKNLAEKFMKIYSMLPADKRTWKYNMNAMKQLRPELDELSKMYIQKYHQESFGKLVQMLIVQQDKYDRAYGKNTDYAQNKIKDLYTRLGNVILKEMRDFNRSENERKNILQNERQPEYQKAEHFIKNENYPEYKKSRKVSERRLKKFYDIKRSFDDFQNAMIQLKRSLKSEYESFQNILEHDKELDKAIYHEGHEQDFRY